MPCVQHLPPWGYVQRRVWRLHACLHRLVLGSNILLKRNGACVQVNLLPWGLVGCAASKPYLHLSCCIILKWIVYSLLEGACRLWCRRADRYTILKYVLPPCPPYTLRCSIILKEWVYSLLQGACRLCCRHGDWYMILQRICCLQACLHSSVRKGICIVSCVASHWHM